MKIFSPHRRKMEASRRFGSREFKNKIKKAQDYKRSFDPRNRGAMGELLHFLHLDSPLVALPTIGILGLAFYYLFVSSYFLVTDVQVVGAQQVPAEQIKAAIQSSANSRWLFIPKNHLLLMSESNTLEALAEEMPLIKEMAKYRRVWPNGVKMEIVERKPGFAFNVNGRSYMVDEEGVVVKELDGANGLVTVYDQVTEDISPGERLNNTKLVVFIMSALKHWPTKINTNIKEIKVPGKASTQVQIVSNEGWGVFFDTTRPVESQVSNLSLILNRQIPASNRLRLAYIDLRFDKWAYYCYKNSPCESQPQAAPTDQQEKIEVEPDAKSVKETEPQ
jgi:cell division septal protein FtsQ